MINYIAVLLIGPFHRAPRRSGAVRVRIYSRLVMGTSLSLSLQADPTAETRFGFDHIGYNDSKYAGIRT